jgi:hypothetical protein
MKKKRRRMIFIPSPKTTLSPQGYELQDVSQLTNLLPCVSNKKPVIGNNLVAVNV